MPVPVIYTSAALLIIGIAPLPYGYYVLLRLIAFTVFTAAAFIAFNRGSKLLPWLYGLAAIVFNPLIKVHFQKEVWAVLDLVAAIGLVVTEKSIKTHA